MRVLIRVEGLEQEGKARDLSTWGTFVECEEPVSTQRVELFLEAGGDSVSVTGEVVRVTPEGFAVAFGVLHPETLVRLNRLVQPASSQTSSPAEESSQEPPAPVFKIQGEEWHPPVTEPILHQWKPEADLVPPPPSSFDQPSWESLPTISPAALEVRQEEETIAEAVAAPEPVSETATGPVENTEQPDVAKPVPTSKPGGGETTEQLPLEKSISQQTQPPSQVVPMEPVQTPDQPEESPANRRATERTEQSIPISFDNLTSLIKEFTHNISFGGLFVYTDRPLEKGKEVAVTLVHPVHGERLTLLSIVAHSSSAPSPDPVSGAPRYGVGVQFRIPLEELKRLLSDFIGSHQKAKPVEEHDNLIEQAQVILNRGARSHHDLLGVNSLAKQDEIRRAYFELVDRFHPDRYYGKVSEASQKVLEELFRNLTKAYEALTT